MSEEQVQEEQKLYVIHAEEIMSGELVVMAKDVEGARQKFWEKVGEAEISELLRLESGGLQIVDIDETDLQEAIDNGWDIADNE